MSVLRPIARPLLLALTALGCSREPDAAPAPAASASAVPVDRLAKGELAPGTESIYGLVLPKGMSITQRFARSIHAAGPLSPEKLANYVRDRVVVSRVELGAARTLFPAAKIKGASAERTFELSIIASQHGLTLLEVVDVTEPKLTEGLSNEQRLKQVGLSPDGKLLDRSKLQ